MNYDSLNAGRSWRRSRARQGGGAGDLVAGAGFAAGKTGGATGPRSQYASVTTWPALITAR
jgi:hypothetical protein